MLAIMNVGKYSIPSVTPSGTDIFRVIKDSAFTSNIKMFASNGNRILGLTGGSLIVSDDNGETWSEVLLDYPCDYLIFINNSFYLLEKTSQTIHYGISSDGLTWTWNTVPTNSEIDSIVQTHNISISNGRIYCSYVGGKERTVSGVTNTYYSYWIYYLDGEQSATQIGEEHYLVYNRTTPLWKKNSKVVTVTSQTTSGTVAYSLLNFSIDGVKQNDGSTGIAQFIASAGVLCDRYFRCSGSTAVNVSAYREVNYSDMGWTYQTEQSANQYAGGMKPTSFFKIGNTFYVAYQYLSSITAYWVKAGSLLDALEIPVEELTKVSDVGLPNSFYIINNKKVLIATTAGHVFTCEVA